MTRQAFGKLSSAQPQFRTGAALSAPVATAFSPNAAGIDPATYAEILGTNTSSSHSTTIGSSRHLTGKPVKWLRFTSGIIDSCVMAFIVFVIYLMNGGAGSGSGVEMAVFRALLAALPVGLAYGIFLEASPLQGTIGKIATGTIITDKNGDRISIGRSIIRNIGKILSSFVPLYLSYSMILWSANRQCLHDMIAGTRVYRKGDGPQKTASVFD